MDTTPTQPPPTARRTPAKRPPKAGWVGPLFSWELIRLARRGQDARARFILAVSLFVVLTAFSLIWFRGTNIYDLFFGATQTLSIAESSAFGSSFSLAFVFGQLAILCLLTPAYAAGGIAEEKDRRTLVYLLVSDLTNREIIFGKFFGRTAFLLGIMFAGLPILAITQLHGGVSLKFLLATYLMTATTVVLLSAVSAVAAAQAETFRGGLFRAYGFTALVVIGGCGGGPLVGPFAVVGYLYTAEFENVRTFWTIAVGYPLLELALTAFAVWLAVLAIRRMRARMTRNTPKPPPWVRERYRDEDRERAKQERLRVEREAEVERQNEARRRLAELSTAIELVPDEFVEPQLPVNADGTPRRLKARRVLVAVPLSPPSFSGKGAGGFGSSIDPSPQPPPPAGEGEMADPSPPAPLRPGERGANGRRWDSERDRKKKKAGYRDPAMHAAKNWTPRPKIASDDDPFYWKEKYTAGAVQTEDDEAMRSMMYLIGGVMALVVVFFLMIAGVALASGSESSRGLARMLLLIAGGCGVFGHLLQIGMSAAGTVCRERQRLTLESLLTIPVPRSSILWPKWVVSLFRGWWWGGPAAGVLVIAFLTTDVTVTAIPALVYMVSVVPFATSYGVWLSIRCRTVNRAVMWYLPLAGLLIAVPIGVCAWATPEHWAVWCGLLFGMTCATTAGTWLLWRASTRAFDVETVLGPGRG